MDKTATKLLVARKLDRLKQIRQRFWAVMGINFSSDDYEDSVRKRGVPKQFRSLDPTQLDVRDHMLKIFQKVIQSIPRAANKEFVMSGLDQCCNTYMTKKNDEDPHYLRNQIIYTIFREVTGQPYSQPRFVSMVKNEDVINSQFLELISHGVGAYLSATPEERCDFSKGIFDKRFYNKVTLPGIPKDFLGVDPNDNPVWNNSDFVLDQLQKIVKGVKDDNKKRSIVKDLDELLVNLSKAPADIDVWDDLYLNTAFKIFRHVTGRSYRHLTRSDTLFMHILTYGIGVYRLVSYDDNRRKEFNRAVLLPDVKKESVDVVTVAQQQHVH